MAARSRSFLVRSIGLVCALSAGVVTSCSALNSFDCFTAPCEAADAASPDPLDAGDAATGDARTPGCVLTRPPPRPSGAAGLEATQSVAILSRISIELPEDGGAPTGLDLDGLCTCSPLSLPDPGACENPRATTSLCDDPGGVDRQSRALVRDVATSFILGDAPLNDAIRAGRLALLVQVTGYNNERDDPDVKVDLLNGVHLAGGDGGPGDPPPRFDDTDSWLLERDTVSTSSPDGGIAASIYSKRGAYVANGTLVAAFDNPIRIGFRILSGSKLRTAGLVLTEARLVARVQPTDAGPAVTEGFLAGKWTLDSALSLAESATGCRRDAVYELARATLCANADLATSGKARCDGISLTIGFQTVAARFSGVVDALDLRCDGGVDDCSR